MRLTSIVNSDVHSMPAPSRDMSDTLPRRPSTLKPTIFTKIFLLIFCLGPFAGNAFRFSFCLLRISCFYDFFFVYC